MLYELLLEDFQSKSCDSLLYFLVQVSIIFPKEVEELAKQSGFCKTDSQDKTSPIFGWSISC